MTKEQFIALYQQSTAIGFHRVLSGPMRCPIVFNTENLFPFFIERLAIEFHELGCSTSDKYYMILPVWTKEVFKSFSESLEMKEEGTGLTENEMIFSTYHIWFADDILLHNIGIAICVLSNGDKRSALILLCQGV